MRFLIDFIKGMAIGIANVIPGVSGGTMAFILGIYDKLTDAIGNFLNKPEERKKFISFLAVIGIGVFAGIILFAKIFTFLLQTPTSEQYTYFLFVGLILGSVPFIMKMHDDMKFSMRRGAVFTVAMLLVLSTLLFGTVSHDKIPVQITGELFGIFNATEISVSYGFWLLACGFMAAGSMVLPGFSGSALLISLGEYNNVLQFVDQRMIIPVLIIGAGAIPGIIFFAKIINKFLTKYPSDTYYFILGLITASIVQIFNEIADTVILSGSPLYISLLTFLIGVVISYFLSKIHK